VAPAVVAAAVVVALAVAGGWWSGGTTVRPPTPISAQASISPDAVHFGDMLTARAVAVVDPRRIDPGSVHLAPQFLSYRIASASRDVRGAGGATTIAWTFALECLGAGCAPGRPQVVLQFPNAVLRYRPVGGSPIENALRLVRETAANGHDPGLQRLALQRLVRELRAAGKPGLADDAGRLAWSNGPPSRARAEELADRVEREVSGT